MNKVAFTIILNGMPFIKEQLEIIPKMFDKWYIIEGVAEPVKDTCWCRSVGDSFNKNGLSIDGTSEFLDKIQSDKIEIIRTVNGKWNGKTEMCNSFMDKVENSILMQIDVDEFWSINTLKEIFKYSEENFNNFDGMIFKCNYFVGKDLVVSNERCYSDSYDYPEWLRLWTVKNKTKFVTHEPPQINGLNKYISKEFTKKNNWIFDHYAYVNKEQLIFKEKYYGYDGALNQWEKLQGVKKFPVYLKDYFKWVNDATTVSKRG